MYKVQIHMRGRWVDLSWSNSFHPVWAIYERRRNRGEPVRFRAN